MGTHRNSSHTLGGPTDPCSVYCQVPTGKPNQPPPSKPPPHLPAETSVSSWALMKRFVISVAIILAQHLLLSSS
ncbi:hypothetical protein LY78DRAFT_97632 [Colletotrichum sublineola]|nr:hypothetical protein LY78DRAFT_97632 [Colletotrichum sublineola]